MPAAAEFIIYAVMVSLALMACAFTALRRALHMYQLCSYQNKSYISWLGANAREVMSPLRLIALAVICAGLLCGVFPLALFGAVAFLFALRHKKAKKPLVYTARVKRLIVTAAAFWCISASLPLNEWINAAAKGSDPPVILVFLPCVVVLLQPVLVMLYSAINAPAEKAIAGRYIRQAEDILRSHPSLTVIGITGSYGKTSTKYFLSELLSTEYNVYMTPGNFNTTLGVVRAVREGLRPIHQIFLCEMGARHRGDIIEICRLVRPTLGVLTYIGQQHMETFGSQQTITETKLELYDWLCSCGGKLFVNADSEIAAAQNYTSGTVFYGSANSTGYRAGDIAISAAGSSFTVTAPGGESCRFTTKLLGTATVQNLTGAIAVAHSMGIPMAKLSAPVRALQPAPHRLQLIRAGAMSIIDDAYNSNPEGARVALDTLAMCAGTKIVITPGLVELGERERECNIALGRHAASVCDCIITVGRHGADVAQGAREQGITPAGLFEADDLGAAMAHARALPGADKFVLLLNDLPDLY